MSLKAIDYFATNSSPRAIADLICLCDSNHVTPMLGEAARAKCVRLGNLPDYVAVAEADAQKEKLLQTHKDIVTGIGQTFSGAPIEIVLHDMRNPLISIVAVQNAIAGRRLGDPNTNFGIQLIGRSCQTDRSAGHSFLSYGLTLKDGRQVRSTTLPLFNNVYGLICTGPCSVHRYYHKFDCVGSSTSRFVSASCTAYIGKMHSKRI